MAKIGEPVRRHEVIPLNPANPIPATPDGPPVKVPTVTPVKPEQEPVK